MSLLISIDSLYPKSLKIKDPRAEYFRRESKSPCIPLYSLADEAHLRTERFEMDLLVAEADFMQHFDHRVHEMHGSADVDAAVLHAFEVFVVQETFIITVFHFHVNLLAELLHLILERMHPFILHAV